MFVSFRGGGGLIALTKEGVWWPGPLSTRCYTTNKAQCMLLLQPDGGKWAEPVTSTAQLSEWSIQLVREHPGCAPLACWSHHCAMQGHVVVAAIAVMVSKKQIMPHRLDQQICFFLHRGLVIVVFITPGYKSPACKFVTCLILWYILNSPQNYLYVW
jgi:hypothetical protein